MLVRIAPEACAVVIARLRAVADDVEDRRARVARSAAHVDQPVPALADVPAMAEQLRDLATDLQRRVDLAVAMNGGPLSLTAHSITINLPGDDESAGAIAALLGARLAEDLRGRPDEVELTRLADVLARYADDEAVMVALFSALSPGEVTALAERALGTGPFALQFITPDQQAWLAARPLFVHAFATGLGTALTRRTGEAWAGAEATAVAWLAAMPDDDIGAAGARALLGAVDDAWAADLVDRVPTVATLLMRPHDLEPRFARLVAAASGPASLDRVDAVRAAFADLGPADRAYLARVEPWLVGNLDGVPFATRAVANRTAVHAAVVDLEAQIAAHDPHGWDYAWLPAATARLETFRGLLDDDAPLWRGERETTGRHQVVLFTPDLDFRGLDQTRFAEIVGDLDTAEHVGILVPGTGANMDTASGQHDRAFDFVRASQGRVAMLTWMGGAFPAEVTFDAFSADYAVDLGPRLAAFTAGMGSPAGVTVTVLGHSYGGSVVGSAEASGMRVDRVVHVESAGIGPGVHGIEDYAAPGTARYSMTAPGDLIALAQDLGGVVHGGDPDTLAGVTRLETGWIDDLRRDQGMLEGPASHSGVFEPRTTAWVNMFNVIIGGTVSLYAPPEVEGGWGYSEVVYPAEDPTYVPPTMEVP